MYNSSKEYLTDYSYSGKTIKNQEEKLGLSKGTYYVKVIKGYFDWTDKSYQLRVNYQSASNWETEFNEDYDHANNLSLNQQKNGSMRTSNDIDMYQFSLFSNGYVSLEFNHDYVDSGSEYWRVYLYNSSKEYLTDYSYSGKTIKTRRKS